MARVNRIKAEGEAYYHVISRVANQAFLFKADGIKDTVVNMLHRAAEFSGVDVLSYVVMDNHFHLCIRVPEKGMVSEEEVLRRVGVLYGENRITGLKKELEALRGDGDDEKADSIIDRYRARMGDLSEFMKTFKQRVTQWFNSNHRHEGALWSGRFKSVLLEEGKYVSNVVDYIHNNPVRAGIATRLRDYRWSAAGAAARGDSRALKGLSLVGEWGGGGGSAGRDRRFGNGVILGSKGFVERMSGEFSHCFKNPVRKPRSVIIGKLEIFITHGQKSA
jgi:REP element-mobilizing transposase RayT